MIVVRATPAPATTYHRPSLYHPDRPLPRRSGAVCRRRFRRADLRGGWVEHEQQGGAGTMTPALDCLTLCWAVFPPVFFPGSVSSRISQLCYSPPHAVWCDLRSAHAYRVLVGARNLML